ncbi:MAG: hypothetical protein ACRC5R_01640 [Mycoplasmatales bacterium]
MITHDKEKLEISSHNLTSDAGLVLVTKYLNKNKVEKIFDKIMFNDKRKDPDYTNDDILSFKLVNKFTGYNSQILQSRHRKILCLLILWKYQVNQQFLELIIV